MRLAATYARVSSDRQKEEETIKSQTAAILEYAEREGYVVPQEWVIQDEGYSGNTLIRPGLERVRDLAAEGRLETLLIHAPDRMSRKYAYQVLLMEELKGCGVNVVFINNPKAETPEDALLLQFQGMIAEYERAQIRERCRRGKLHRARSGSVNVLSGAPYGYRYVRKTDETEASYEIIEEEARIVRQIYEWFVEDGWKIAQIVRKLNEDRVPTKRKARQWERSTVWGILKNPAYMGEACFGKTEVAERVRVTRRLRARGGYATHKAHRDRPREDWIRIPVPRIVSKEIVELAEERLEENKRFASRRTKTPTLLQGMLVCQECGYALYRSTTRTSRKVIGYYRCIGSDAWRFHDRKAVCSNRPIRQDSLDDLVWEEVMRLLTDPEVVRTELTRRVEAARSSDPVRMRREELEKALSGVESAVKRLVDAYQEGLLGLEEFRERLPAVRRKQKGLESDLQALDAQEGQVRMAEAFDGVEGFLARLRTSAETSNVELRQRVLRMVVKEIEIGSDSVTIKHVIPLTGPPKVNKSADDGEDGDEEGVDISSLLLRKERNQSTLGECLSASV